MSLWLIFSLLSVVALAGSEISQKVSLTQKVDISAITNNFYVWTLQGIIGFILAILTGQFNIDISSLNPWKLLIISVVYFAGGTFFYTSYKGNSPSLSLILGTVSVVISSILGNLFLNDGYNTLSIFGIVLILSAILILNFNRSEKFSKYNLFAILGGICFGIAFTLDKSFVTEISPFMYLGFLCISIAIVSAVTSFKLIIRETSRLKFNNFIPMISSASFGSSFNLFTFFAYRNGANVGVADAINNTTVFFVILVEIFILKDRSHLLRKIGSAAIATTGVILIGIS